MQLSEIRIDGGTQIRAEMNNDKIGEYAEAMTDGEKFPPVVLFFDGASHWLADGFHRFHAAKRAKLKTIEATVRQGTLEEAIVYACEANARVGIPMTAADRRKAVLTLLNSPLNDNWSLAEIARRVGVSKMTVSRINAEQKPALETKEPAKQKKDSQKPAKAKPDVVVPDEPDRLQEIVGTIQELTDENNRLKDVIALGQWDATEIEKIDAQETIEELRERVRILELDNAALRDSRDMFQARNAELMATVKSLQAKIKKLEG